MLRERGTVGPDTVSPEACASVVVRGLGRYLELQELAKKQKGETEERYQKAFLTHPTGQRPEHYTIPEPFKLDHKDREDRAAFKKNQIASELAQKREALPRSVARFHPPREGEGSHRGAAPKTPPNENRKYPMEKT